MEGHLAQLKLRDGVVGVHGDALSWPHPLPAAAQTLERELGVLYAPRPRAPRSSPLNDACEEMAQALIDSPFLKMPERPEGMKLLRWAEAVFDFYKDAPFVDKIEFEKANFSLWGFVRLQQLLDFLYRKLVDPSRGYPDFHAAIVASRYGDDEQTIP